MTVAGIIQPSYIPWKGFFDIIYRSDVFIFLDDVQYTKRDWRNRNRVKSPRGTEWLTVPVKSQSRATLIKDVKIDYSTDWFRKHLSTIQHCYAGAPYYKEFRGTFEEALIGKTYNSISELNISMTLKICQMLGVEDTEYLVSSELEVQGGGSDKILGLCCRTGATRYITGPSAMSYLVMNEFEERGIEISCMNYSYPVYPQLFGEFDHRVTVLDMIFNLGCEASKFIWGEGMHGSRL